METIIQHRIQGYLTSAPSQFGFKAKHGCDMAIFALKETAKCYVKSGSPVFACFLDASKAFDRVNHAKLFVKLKKRNVPMILLKILS